MEALSPSTKSPQRKPRQKKRGFKKAQSGEQAAKDGSAFSNVGLV
jgi:hypothetical protein